MAPSVVNAAKRFAELGVHVDLVTLEADMKVPSHAFPCHDVRVIQVSRFSRQKSWVKSDTFVSRAAPIINFAQLIYRSMLEARKGRPDFVIGVDPIGLIAAFIARIASHNKPRFVYWSLELLVRKDFRRISIKRLIKGLEAAISRMVDLIVVQDDARGQILRRENGISGTAMAFVPNSALGPTTSERTDYLHELLDLTKDTRIVLHAGMICEPVMPMELAASTRYWPDGYVLVLHERQKRDEHEPYLKALSEIGGDRTRLSLNPVPLDEIDKVFASAFIGLVVYSDGWGENFSTVGLASGKLSFFLRNGIPVIVNSIPALRNLVSTTTVV